MKNILTPGGHKFILAKTSEGNFVVISMEISSETEENPGHKQIFEAHKNKLDLVKVLGGGLLIFAPGSKAIVIGGKSGTYGQVDKSLVKELLLKDERFTDHKVKIVK
jgi:hypothetical protein